MSSKGIYTNTMKMDPDVFDNLNQKGISRMEYLEKLKGNINEVESKLRSNEPSRLVAGVLSLMAAAILAIQFFAHIAMTVNQALLIITLSLIASAISIALSTASVPSIMPRNRRHIVVAITMAVLAFIVTGGLSYAVDLVRLAWASLAHPVSPGVKTALEAYFLIASALATYAVYRTVKAYYDKKDNMVMLGQVRKDLRETSIPPENSVFLSCLGSVGDKSGLCSKVANKVDEFTNVVTVRVIGEEAANDMLKEFDNVRFSYTIDDVEVRYLGGGRFLFIYTKQTPSGPYKYYEIVRLAQHRQIDYVLPVRAAHGSFGEAYRYSKEEEATKWVIDDILKKIGKPPSMMVVTMGRTGPSRALAYPSLRGDIMVMVGGGLKIVDEPVNASEGGAETTSAPVLIMPANEPVQRPSEESAAEPDSRAQWRTVMDLIRTSTATILITKGRDQDENAARALASLLAAQLASSRDEPLKKLSRFSYKIHGLALIIRTNDSRETIRRIMNEEYDYISVSTKIRVGTRAVVMTGNERLVPRNAPAFYTAPTPIDVPVALVFPLTEDELREVFTELPPDLPMPRQVNVRDVAKEFMSRGEYARVRDLITSSVKSDEWVRDEVLKLLGRHAELIEELKEIANQERELEVRLKLVRDPDERARLEQKLNELRTRRDEVEKEAEDIAERVASVLEHYLPNGVII